MIGQTIGPYHVLGKLGEGGMGEVYRARDTELNRDVALKILPAEFASDPDRLARFKREAHVLASLNHPNVAAIYGFENSGDVHALVLELVEGPTLADTIADGPLPVRESLSIARQIAEALEAAHEQGIVHRDLKPANIKLRPDGTVKVLDFGLAKALDPVAGTAVSTGATNTQSPTIASPFGLAQGGPAMTQVGMILGTAAYMSPEQAKGRLADKRSDVWAFGSVFYEMLTGKRAFDGEDIGETLASVIKSEPDWNALPSDLPRSVVLLAKRCLEKDRRRRVADVSTILFVLNDDAALAPAKAALPGPASSYSRLTLVSAATLLLGGVIGSTAVWMNRPSAPGLVSRTTLGATGSSALWIDGGTLDLTATPDGRRIVYVGNNGTQLFVRDLNSLEPVSIASGVLREPSVSPNGEWISFTERATLKKVAMTGGAPIELVRVDGPAARGSTWVSNDTIIFATGVLATGLQRVSAEGGAPVVLTRPDVSQGEADHLWPVVLPGGNAVLFTITPQTGGLDRAQVAVLDLRTGTHKVLIRGGSHAQYADSGHLVYVAGDTLRAIPFDLSTMETRGTAVPVVPGVVTTAQGGGDFAIANNGTFVYAQNPGGITGDLHTLVWVDQTGTEESIAAPLRRYAYPRLSPDGTSVALTIFDENPDLWRWNLRAKTLTRLTVEPGGDQIPVWTSDGHRIIFASEHGGPVRNLWWMAADRTGAAERLTTNATTQSPSGVSPDGKQLLFDEVTASNQNDLMQLSLDSEHRVTPLLQSRFNERAAVVSPNGRWMAYESDSSGSLEVWVRPYPGVDGGPWQVSSGGGAKPLWARNGRQLFYVAPNFETMSVSVESAGEAWRSGTPRRVVAGTYYNAPPRLTQDISLDGKRFLMVKLTVGDAASTPAVVVVQNWFEELKQRVPATR